MRERLLVTGDVHFPIDREKLNILKERGFSAGDTIIVCGDFGGVWYARGTAQEKNRERLISEYPFTIVWVDGNHENFDSIETYPLVDKYGGKVHQITENCFHLLRGSIYTICGKKIFAFGGAESTDRDRRIKGESWWPQEVPSDEEVLYGNNQIASCDGVNYVITHDAPASLLSVLGRYKGRVLPFNLAFDRWAGQLRYDAWFFGHHHRDAVFDLDGVQHPLADLERVGKCNKPLVCLYESVYDITGQTPREVLPANYFTAQGDTHVFWR